MLKTFSGRRPSQDEAELRGFIKYLQDAGVRSYMEIGARHGDSFHEIVSSLPLGSRALAVDLPGALWGTSKSKDSLIAAVRDLNEKGYQCTYLFGNSQQDATKRLIVGRGPYDAILIDGDHTLAGVTRDWQQYGDMAPIIAFHDIVGTGMREKVKNNPVEVPILWESLKSQHETVEFVSPESAMGIGIVCKST